MTLHVTGTSLVLLMALQHPEIVMAGVLAGMDSILWRLHVSWLLQPIFVVCS